METFRYNSRKEMMDMFEFVFVCMVVYVVGYNLYKLFRKIDYKTNLDEIVSENAMSAHSCFESEKKYPFESGRRTPKQEFWRRYFKRKDQHGDMNQRIANAIADDVAAEVRSMKSSMADRKRKLTF